MLKLQYYNPLLWPVDILESTYYLHPLKSKYVNDHKKYDCYPNQMKPKTKGSIV